MYREFQEVKSPDHEARRMAQEDQSLHAMTVQEYAKVRAVLERIAGLRRAMVATVIGGVVTSFFVWVMVTSAEVLTLNPAAFGIGLEYGLGTFIPFIALIGYFSYIVNKHIDRLSKGKYEPPIMID